MKPCTYCGRENEDSAFHCVECGTEFQPRNQPRKATDPKLTDSAAALVTVAKFSDLIHATLLKDELELAGIAACIPEDMSASPFGDLVSFASITVQVATRDYDAAKEIVAGHASHTSPKDEAD